MRVKEELYETVQDDPSAQAGDRHRALQLLRQGNTGFRIFLRSKALGI